MHVPERVYPAPALTVVEDVSTLPTTVEPAEGLSDGETVALDPTVAEPPVDERTPEVESPLNSYSDTVPVTLCEKAALMESVPVFPAVAYQMYE